MMFGNPNVTDIPILKKFFNEINIFWIGPKNVSSEAIEEIFFPAIANFSALTLPNWVSRQGPEVFRYRQKPKRNYMAADADTENFQYRVSS